MKREIIIQQMTEGEWIDFTEIRGDYREQASEIDRVRNIHRENPGGWRIIARTEEIIINL